MTLEEVLKLATQYRAEAVKVGEIEIRMSPMAFLTPNELASEKQKVGAEHGEPTAEELLMWSAPGPLPEIDAKPPEEPS